LAQCVRRHGELEELLKEVLGEMKPVDLNSLVARLPNDPTPRRGGYAGAAPALDQAPVASALWSVNPMDDLDEAAFFGGLGSSKTGAAAGFAEDFSHETPLARQVMPSAGARGGKEYFGAGNQVRTVEELASLRGKAFSSASAEHHRPFEVPPLPMGGGGQQARSNLTLAAGREPFGLGSSAANLYSREAILHDFKELPQSRHQGQVQPLPSTSAGLRDELDDEYI
jgi:hypothetical protein